MELPPRAADVLADPAPGATPDATAPAASPAAPASADVAASAHVAPTARIWHLAQIREDARVGENVVVGRGAYVGPGVQVGDNAKIQNYALVYEPAVLGPGVFVGPAAVLTNDRLPRAVNPDGSQKSAADWEPVGVRVDEGASIGARAVCVAPVRIGAWAMVAAGAVVTSDVPAHALVVGVPARRVGWVGRTGARLVPDPAGDTDPTGAAPAGTFRCPDTGAGYRQVGESLVEIEVA